MVGQVIGLDRWIDCVGHGLGGGFGVVGQVGCSVEIDGFLLVFLWWWVWSYVRLFWVLVVCGRCLVVFGVVAWLLFLGFMVYFFSFSVVTGA